MAVSWLTPKTDWTTTDAFNYTDFNRIRNNVTYINEHLSNKLTLDDMGSTVSSIDMSLWDYRYFNAIEYNIELLNEQIINADIGARKTFYPNGAFITADELNRIESALVTLKGNEEGTRAYKLPYRLGTKQGTIRK